MTPTQESVDSNSDLVFKRVTIASPTPEAPLGTVMRIAVTTRTGMQDGLIPVTQIAGIYAVGTGATRIEFQNGKDAELSLGIDEVYDHISSGRDARGIVDMKPFAKLQAVAAKKNIFLDVPPGEPAQPGDEVNDGIYLGRVDNSHWVVEKSAGKKMAVAEAFKLARDKRFVTGKDWRLPNINTLGEMFNKKSVGVFKNTYEDSMYLSGEEDPEKITRHLHVNALTNETLSQHKSDDTSVARLVYMSATHPVKKPSR